MYLTLSSWLCYCLDIYENLVNLLVVGGYLHLRVIGSSSVQTCFYFSILSMYVCLFIINPVGSMIHPKRKDKYSFDTVS